MENRENKETGSSTQSFGGSIGSQGGEKLGGTQGEKLGGAQGEKFGARVASSIGGAAGAAGRKVDQAIDYVDDTTRTVRESFDRIREEGWQGLRERTIDYTRREPIAALMIAVGVGVMLGWLTRRR